MLFDKFSTILGALGGAAAVFVIMWAYTGLVSVPAAEKRGYERALLEARTRAIDLIDKRSKDNAEINNLDLRAFCLEFGGKWVSNDCTSN